MKRNLIITLVALLVVAAIWFSYAASGKTSYQKVAVAEVSSPSTGQINQGGAASAAPIAITPKDLAQAGFVSPVTQAPTSDGGYQPASYFWVNGQKSVDAISSVSVHNLIMVSVETVPAGYKTLFDYGTSYGSSSAPFLIESGAGREFKGLSQDRTAINFIKNSRYAVIIGSDALKTEALARLVAGKIF